MSEAAGSGGLRIRPYALTGGRTRSTLDLPLESLVCASERGRLLHDQLGVEERRILDLAAEPVSLAELSAHMGVVVGAVRVLVGDLVSSGFLDSRSTTVNDASDIRLLERVLDGLKAL